MKEALGLIDIDQSDIAFVCKTLSPYNRRKSIELIRRVNPSAKISIDGTLLRFSVTDAVALRASIDSSEFTWSENAAMWITTFSQNYSNLSRSRRRLWELQRHGTAKKLLSDYSNFTNLDEHQIIAVAAMTDKTITGICLFDEQGLGKTVMAIHSFDRLKQESLADAVLIFAPKNMLEEWKKDFERFMGGKYRIQILSGERRKKYQSLLESADVYITNYETAYSLEDSLRSILNRKIGKVVLVVDESFYIKNRNTRRGIAIRRLRNLCERCWVLCGTPAPNNALDVVHQFEVADAGATFAGVELPKNGKRLQEVIKTTVESRGVYLRRLKRDVLPELPAKQFELVVVPMESEQQSLYGNALRLLVKDVKASDEIIFNKQYASFLSRKMKLLQICSHPGQIVDQYQGLPAKMVALDGLLRHLIDENGEKVVLWSYFRYTIDQLIRRYDLYKPVKLDGSVQDTTKRSQAIRSFQEDSETMLFVGNPAAGGTGITLTRSCTMIYESFSPQTAHYLQSLDRIHRRGQTRDVYYYVLLCKGSIEEDEYERLLRKEIQSAELFSDPLPEATPREVFLEELIGALKKL